MVDMLPIPILILTKVLMVLPNPDMVNPPTDNPVMVPLTPILLPWVDILVTLPIPILMVEVILPTMVDTKPRPFSLSFLFLPIFCDFPVLCAVRISSSPFLTSIQFSGSEFSVYSSPVIVPFLLYSLIHSLVVS